MIAPVPVHCFSITFTHVHYMDLLHLLRIRFCWGFFMIQRSFCVHEKWLYFYFILLVLFLKNLTCLRKYLRTEVTPSLHLPCSENGGSVKSDNNHYFFIKSYVVVSKYDRLADAFLIPSDDIPRQSDGDSELIGK